MLTACIDMNNLSTYLDIIKQTGHVSPLSTHSLLSLWWSNVQLQLWLGWSRAMNRLQCHDGRYWIFLQF